MTSRETSNSIMAPELESQVTVVLLNWKRLTNNVKIVSTLVGSNDIAEIRIWNNNPEVKLTIEVCLLSGLLSNLRKIGSVWLLHIAL